MFKVASYVVVLIIGMAIGSQKDPDIRVVKETEVRYRPYERSYKLPRNELITELKKYDLGKPRLTGSLSGNIFKVKAGLNERDWEKDFHLEVGKDSNWKFYVGAAVLVVGGIIVLL